MERKIYLLGPKHPIKNPIYQTWKIVVTNTLGKCKSDIKEDPEKKHNMHTFMSEKYIKLLHTEICKNLKI